MKTDDQIRAHVMRRVRAIYVARQLKRPAPRIALIGALLAGIASSVSVVQVALNALAVTSFSGFLSFVTAAFLGTTLAVQVMVLGVVCSIGWFFFDGFRVVRSRILPEYAPEVVGVR